MSSRAARATSSLKTNKLVFLFRPLISLPNSPRPCQQQKGSHLHLSFIDEEDLTLTLKPHSGYSNSHTQAWVLVPVIPAFGRLRKKDGCEFEANMGYIVVPGQPALQNVGKKNPQN